MAACTDRPLNEARLRQGRRHATALSSPPVCALLVLWDIDHTLTENHGVDKETYALAFELLTGTCSDGRAHGTEIMRNMLAAHGIEAVPAHQRSGGLN